MQLNKKNEFHFQPVWYRGIEYPKEQERGYDFNEDLYVVNDPSRLTFIIPAGLADGTYELKVTTQFSGSGSKLLKTPHSAAKTIYIGKAPEGGGGSSGSEEENPLG